MATKNIFASLQDDSDNEGPKVEKKAPAAKVDAKTEQKPKENNQRGTQRRDNAPASGNAPENRKDNNTRGKFPRDGQKPKGVPTEHNKDRHSGTGHSAYGNRPRKDGAGKGNVGTVKSELKTETESAPVETKPVVVEEVPEVPEPVDDRITAEEYFKKFSGEEKTEEKKVERKVNLDELKRDKLELLVSKTEKTLDTGLKGQPKRKQANNTYSVGCNTDNSDLLGVKTGATYLQYVVKQEGEDIVGSIKPSKTAEQPKEKVDRERKPHHNTKGKKFNESEGDFPKLE